MSGATDKYFNTATSITSTGFLAINHGSPLTNSCGLPWDSGASVATMSWLALGTSSSSINSITCNNNTICDANESCNCADCNGEPDHCGLSGTAQLICTKDTVDVSTYF